MPPRKTSDRTDALDAFKRDVVAAVSDAVVSASSTVEAFFGKNAERLILSSLGIHHSFSRLECQNSNGFAGAFISLVRDLAKARARTFVDEEVGAVVGSLTGRSDAFAAELRELAATEYGRALYSEVHEGIRRAESDLVSRVTTDVVAQIESVVRHITPGHVADLRAALFADLGAKKDR